MKRKLPFLLIAAFAAVTPVGRATAVPALLLQQGRLFDTAGNPKTGTVTMVFSIYATAAGGTPLWTETDVVPLDQGYFSVELGAKTALPTSLWDGTSRYVAVTVGGDAEMTPREPIASVPYAQLASQADHAISADSATTASAVTGNISAAQITGAFSPAQLPSIPAKQISGTLTTAQLPSSIPASLISGPIDGSLVSKVLQCTAADAAASASGALATTISDLQTSVNAVKAQTAALAQGHTVTMSAVGCVVRPADASTITIDNDAIFNGDGAPSVQTICSLPMRLKSTTTVTGLTLYWAGLSISCLVYVMNAPGSTVGNTSQTYTGPGSTSSTDFYRSLALGGPYTATAFPSTVVCTLGADSGIRAFSWNESE